MPYATQYPTNVPTYTHLPDYQDSIDDVKAVVVNDPKKELLACLIELGTLPKGSMADLSTRLAVSLNADGSLKDTLSPSFVNLTLSGVLNVNGNDIKSTGVINMKADGDNDDYLYFVTPAGVAKLLPIKDSLYTIGASTAVFAEGWFDKIASDGDITLDPAGGGAIINGDIYIAGNITDYGGLINGPSDFKICGGHTDRYIIINDSVFGASFYSTYGSHVFKTWNGAAYADAFEITGSGAAPIIKFGTRTPSGDAAITGYITIQDSAGNIRKLAIIN